MFQSAKYCHTRNFEPNDPSILISEFNPQFADVILERILKSSSQFISTQY